MSNNEDNFDQQVSINTGDIENRGGEVNIAGGDIFKGYTAEQVSELLAQITTSFTPKPFTGQSPYIGLATFDQEDSELFFGRESLIEELIQRIEKNRTIFITGPSGSGKSSLVRAGLIPALKQGAVASLHSERWLYETMVPGREPFNGLARVASSLAENLQAGKDIREIGPRDVTVLAEWCEVALKDGRDKRAVIFIDQFEEVFTQVRSETERTAFLNLLTHAATTDHGRTIILCCIRSDFISDCAAYPQLNALLNQQFLQIGPMQPDELVSAIAQPAIRVGLRIDPELIAKIVNDMQGEPPGALPLMQFALKDLFDVQAEKGGVIALTLEDYIQRGGIRKSLQRHADSVFDNLDSHERELAKSIFSRLIEIGQGAQYTRRNALFDELVPANLEEMEVHTIIQKLTDARLITADKKDDKESITLAHEKLIEAWPWLDNLVKENRESIALQNEVAADAKAWDENQRNTSYLYSGARLSNVQEQITQNNIVLSGLAQEFVRTSQFRKRLGRATLAGVISIIVLSLIVAVIVFSNQADTNKLLAMEKEAAANAAGKASFLAQANASTAQAFSTESAQNASTAEARRIEAEYQTRLAVSRQLATQSLSEIGKLDLALLLSLQSYLTSPTDEAFSAMLRTLNYSERPFQFIYGEPHEMPESMAASSDGTLAAVGYYDGTFVIFDLESDSMLQSMNIGHVWAIQFLPDNRLMFGETGGTIFIWEQGEEIPQIRGDVGQPIVALSFSDTEEQVFAIDRYGNLSNWNMIDEFASWIATPSDFLTSAAFSRDGRYLVFETDSSIICYSINEQKEIFTKDAEVSEVAINPDGTQIAAIGYDGNVIVYLWDFQTEAQSILTGNNEINLEFDNLNPEISHLKYSPNGKFLALNGGSTVYVWDTISAKLFPPPFGFDESIGSIAFSHDSNTILAALADGNVIRWKLPPSGEEIKTAKSSSSATLSPDGTMAAYSFGGSGLVRLWDISTGKPANGQLGNAQGRIIDAGFSPSGEPLGLISHPEGLRLWNLETAKPVGPLLSEMSAGHLVIDSANSALLLNYDDLSLEAINAYTGARLVLPSLPESFDSIEPISESEYQIAITSSISETQIIDTLTGEIIGMIEQGIDLFYPRAYMATDSVSWLAGFVKDNLIVWDTTTGSHVLEQSFNELWDRFPISLHGSPVETMVLSHDGKYLATKSLQTDAFSNLVIIWNLDYGIVEKTLGVNDLLDIMLAPHDDKLIGIGRDGSMQVWSFPELESLWNLSGVYSTPLQTIRFSNDGNQFIAIDKAGNAGLWDLETGTRLPLLWNVHLSGVVDLSFGSDNRRLASVGADNTIAIWSTSTGNLESGPKQLEFPISIVAFDDTGNRLAIGGSDGSLVVWQPKTGEILVQPEYLDSAVTVIKFHPTQPWLAAAGSDEVVHIIDLNNWTHLYSFDVDETINELGWDDGGETLFVAGDKMLVGFNTNDGNLQSDMSNNQNDLGSFMLAGLRPDSQHALTLDMETLSIWDVNEGNSYGPPIRLYNDRVLDAKILPGRNVLTLVQNKDTGITRIVTLSFTDWYTAICNTANRKFTSSERETYQLDTLPENVKIACD